MELPLRILNLLGCDQQSRISDAMKAQHYHQRLKRAFQVRLILGGDNRSRFL
jgi:hypothetical protein